MLNECGMILYLIQEGHYRKHNEDINKIGRTDDFKSRINEYQDGTQIISVKLADAHKKYEYE
jgi:hypothetical protein